MLKLFIGCSPDSYIVNQHSLNCRLEDCAQLKTAMEVIIREEVAQMTAVITATCTGYLSLERTELSNETWKCLRDTSISTTAWRMSIQWLKKYWLSTTKSILSFLKKGKKPQGKISLHFEFGRNTANRIKVLSN